MPNSSALQIPSPSNWQDFESLCWELWRELLHDPNTQKNGRQGQAQAGVDVFGQRNQQSNHWVGVQCKGKDGQLNKVLTETDLKKSVEDAKTFSPPIREFILATTSSASAKIQKIARELSDENMRNGSFSITVCSWEFIKGYANQFPDLFEKYCFIQTSTGVIREQLQKIEEKIGVSRPLLIQSLDPLAADEKGNAALNIIRSAIIENKIDFALKELNKFKDQDWATSSSKIKYRILSLMGSAYYKAGNDKKSAENFIAALQHNADDEKALLNAGYGWLFLGDYDKSLLFAQKVLEKNPLNCNACSIIVNSRRNENVEAILQSIPKECRTSAEVCYAVAHIYRNNRDLTKAREWLELAAKASDEEESFEIKAALAEVMLAQIREIPTIIFSKEITSSQKIDLTTALGLLTSAWEKVQDTEIKKSKAGWLTNRGLIKRMLGDWDGAAKDMDLALGLNPSDSQIISNRAALAWEIGDHKKVLSTIEGSGIALESSPLAMLYAEVLTKLKEYDKALDIIGKFIKLSPPSENRELARQVTVEIYIAKNDFVSARQFIEESLNIYPTSVFLMAEKAKVERKAGNIEQAKKNILEAFKLVAEQTSFKGLVLLSDELYELRLYEECSQILEKINLDNARLANCYYRSGKAKKALKIAEDEIQRNGPSEFFTNIALQIYRTTGSLKDQDKLCREYLAKYPDDFNMLLEHAFVNLQLGNLADVDSFLKTITFPQNWDQTIYHNVALLFHKRGFDKEALETVYEARRQYKRIPEVHGYYVGLFLNVSKKLDAFLDVKEVREGTAVALKDCAGHEKWWIIDNRKDSYLEGLDGEEISPTNPKVKILMGKKENDTVVLDETSPVEDKLVVSKIQSKYVRAFQESLENRDVPGLWKFSLGSIKDDGKPENIEQIYKPVDLREKRGREVEQLYNQGFLTIGGFAQLMGSHIREVWGGMATRPNFKIRCAIGAPDERTRALNILSNSPFLVLDEIALYTIHGLSIEDSKILEGITKAFGRLGVVRSTLDSIHELISMRRNIQSEGFITLVKRDEKYFRHEVNAEDIRQDLSHLESIIDWVNKNCEILPCNKILDFKKEEREEFYELFGQSSIESVLVGAESGRILFSDDERLRSVGLSDFKVEGVWTQAVLQACLNKSTIDKPTYQNALIKLANSNYYYISIDKDTLFEAARQSNWVPDKQFLTMVNILSTENTTDNNSALTVAGDFIFALWNQPLLNPNRHILLLPVLDAVFKNRNTAQIRQDLFSLISNKFIMLPSLKKEVLSLIEEWCKRNSF